MIPDYSSFLHLNFLSSLLSLFRPEGVGGNLVSRDDGIEGQGGKIVKIHSPVQHYRFPSPSEGLTEERGTLS